MKPYIPYDIVPSSYRLPMATDDAGNALALKSLNVPSWIVESDIPLNKVFFSEEANVSLEFALSIKRNKMKRISRSKEEVLELIKQVMFHAGSGSLFESIL